MPDYLTVFEISSPNWLLWLIGAIPLFVGLLLARTGSRFSQTLILIGLTATITGSILLLREVSAVRDYRLGNYVVTEGIIDSSQKGSTQCFALRSNEFCCEDLTPGFRPLAASGGALRAGSAVRVAHHGPTILRLEVARERLLPDWKPPTLLPILLGYYGITIWMNVAWKRAIRGWFAPPHSERTQKWMRFYFAAQLVAVTVGIVCAFVAQPLSRENAVPIFGLAAIMNGFMAAMATIGLLYGERQDRLASQPGPREPRFFE